MAQTAKLQQVPVNKLVPYERNAKTHSAEQVEKIKASIEEFGFVSPILIDGEYNIIAGHGRVLAAKELGMDKVPAVFVEGLTEAQRRAYIIADNKLTELGGWDMDLVKVELTELNEMDFDVSVTGFDIDLDEEPTSVVEDDYTPVEPEEPKTRFGEIWKLGDHLLICGDSTDITTFEKLLEGHKADICVTSPPYNAGHLDIKLSEERGGGYQAATQKKYISDDDQRTEDEYYDFICANIDALIANCNEVFYNVGVGAGSKTMIARLLHDYSGNFKDLLYWEKDNPMPVIAEGVISSAVELIICLGENGSRSFNAFDDRLFHGVIKGPSASRNPYADVHKATFPVYLPSEIITRFTKSGATVVDCFGGTGTTLIACEQLKRKCRMIELEPLYCDIIIDRWETLTGRKAELLNV